MFDYIGRFDGPRIRIRMFLLDLDPDPRLEKAPADPDLSYTNNGPRAMPS